MRQAARLYRVEVRRGEARALEATHHVTLLAWDEETERAPGARPALEELDWETTFRSGCKPFQALPLVERGHAERFGFDSRELALMCASHSGTPDHVAVARSILQKIGVEERNLLCGFHHPYDSEAGAYTRLHPEESSPIYNNCSGKHAGMLALAVAEGWPVEEYVDPEHPVQQACVRAIAEVCGEDPGSLPVVTDGCSAANPRLRLSSMARGFHRLAVAGQGESSERDRALLRLRDAMARHPELVAGESRICTDLMRATGGRVVAKTGAEGLECIAIPDARVGVVAKCHDGSERPKVPAMLDFLRLNGWLSEAAWEKLDRWAHPQLRSHRGIVVGAVELIPEDVPARLP